jgi:hypothetical protein
LQGRIGRPDYGVHVNELLAGYVELKEPGKGADPQRYTGHDRRQWERFAALPNILYCDANDWALFRSGDRTRRVSFDGDIRQVGDRSVTEGIADAIRWLPLLHHHQ